MSSNLSDYNKHDLNTKYDTIYLQQQDIWNRATIIYNTPLSAILFYNNLVTVILDIKVVLKL